ncbi:MAG: hypothetical protein HKO62_01645, partial [Gammaproteobacteria bacterium]|nr:hypothetical protein [Gammaproteobacteria bacterium]
TSRNAFCTECFPDEAGNTVGGAAGAIDAILQDPGAAGNEELLVNLNGIAREFRDLSLQDLVQLLNMIARELKRRGRG